MKILIFGASGRIGSIVTELAATRGHEVIGFYRPNEPVNDQVEAVFGSALSADDVDSAVEKCNVVISCLGHVRGGDPYLQTTAIGLIAQSMKQHGKKRIVSLTGSGARLEGDKPSLIDLALNSALKIVDPERIKDGSDHIEVLIQTDLDWTVVRTLKHSNTRPSPNLILTEHGPARLLSSREQIAETMLDLAESNDWIKKAPILC